MQKYMNLISYFGGKYPHLKWLISKFPAGNYHFIDIMCGSANVALNVNYPLITVNDINDEVINLFNVLRDNFEDFSRAIYFTPFSRTELNMIVTDNLNNVKLSPVERARRYFVMCQLGFGANGSQNNHYGCGFEWQIQKSHFYRVTNWNLKLNRLSRVVSKLRQFQIENRNAFELYEHLNYASNIIYWDPPYLLTVRSGRKRYRKEVDIDFHCQLSELSKNAKCFMAISGYDSPLYNDIFSHLHKSTDKLKKSNVSKKEVSECLWTNYDPDAINGNYKLKFKETLHAN